MSIVNTPIVLSRVADLGAAFTITSPNLIITNPDGTTYTSLASVSPSGSANPHTLSALFVPSMGGLHEARFQGVVNTVTLNFPFKFWTAWSDVYSDVRDLLGTNSRSLPDSRLDPEFYGIVTEMVSFSGMPAYTNFTATYKTGFDQGVAKLLASRVRPWIGGKRPTGEVSFMKKGNTSVQYSVGSPRMNSTLEEQWWEQGMNILQANITEIATAMADDRYGDLIMTRGDKATGNHFPSAGWSVQPGGGSIVDCSTSTGGNEF